MKSDDESKVNDTQTKRIISQTAQMLAHDVRKPFMSLATAIKVLEATKTLDKMESIIKLIGKELSFSLQKIDHLLDDFVALGEEKPNSLEAISAKILIQECLDTVLADYPGKKVELSFDYKNDASFSADRKKLVKVLSFIITSAIHASSKPKIAFKTMLDSPYIQLLISYSRSLLTGGTFEANSNLTSCLEKKDLNGLRLLIAKNLIETQGGQFSYSLNSEGSQIEFAISLMLAT